jgi:hypothetical protein
MNSWKDCCGIQVLSSIAGLGLGARSSIAGLKFNCWLGARSSIVGLRFNCWLGA